MTIRHNPGSFRDPSGFLFYEAGTMYRTINISYKENYDFLMNSCLYKALVSDNLLISHEEIDVKPGAGSAYKIIKPELVPFISYPYEWRFSQLKDAALLTLRIQKRALEFGMSLKDCSAYNVQFYKGRPVFIDTLSFEKYQKGKPWAGYRQFCQHFLAPFALMAYSDVRLNQLLRVYIDGIPLDLASKLLPFRTRFSFSLLIHIHLHAKSQAYFADKKIQPRGREMNQTALLGIVDSLESLVKNMNWKPRGTEWGDYYDFINYSSATFQRKKEIVAGFISRIKPSEIWDLGANTGVFSRVAASGCISVISFDVDMATVEKNYCESIRNSEKYILPLLLDLTNPSPGIGWENSERMSLLERGPANTVLALALIHHLAISNNVPFYRISRFLGGICDNLIIEFVPKTDSQVQKLLATREDIFTGYDQHSFEAEFEKNFKIEDSVRITDSERTLYLMKNRGMER